MNLFIFPDVYPHRDSPMSILILFFPLFSAPWRLRAMPKPHRLQSKPRFDTPLPPFPTISLFAQ